MCATDFILYTHSVLAARRNYYFLAVLAQEAFFIMLCGARCTHSAHRPSSRTMTPIHRRVSERKNVWPLHCRKCVCVGARTTFVHQLAQACGRQRWIFHAPQMRWSSFVWWVFGPNPHIDAVCIDLRESSLSAFVWNVLMHLAITCVTTSGWVRQQMLFEVKNNHSMLFLLFTHPIWKIKTKFALVARYLYS
jgi:hypothetical protein